MRLKAIIGILVTLILFCGLIGVCGTPIMEEIIPPPIEEPQPPPGDLWMPYAPNSEQVDLAFWMAGEIAYVNATIQFGTPCYAITDWGTVTKSSYGIWVDSVIWFWLGICIQIVPPPVSHTYEIGPLENGTYTFTFKAWSTDVKSVSFTVPFIVENLPPTAQFIYSPTFPYVGQAVTFDASGSSDTDGTIASYAWDFGDGFIETDVVTTHNYESAGTFTVTLTVTDDLGAIDKLQKEITVDPLPTLTITVNKIKTGSTETILLELMDDDYDGFITQDIDNRILNLIRRIHKTTTFNLPGEYTATKGAWKVTVQSRNDFTITFT